MAVKCRYEREADETAVAAAKAAEDKGLSMSTQNRKWRAVFAAQDALKAAGVWC